MAELTVTSFSFVAFVFISGIVTGWLFCLIKHEGRER